MAIKARVLSFGTSMSARLNETRVACQGHATYVLTSAPPRFGAWAPERTPCSRAHCSA